MPASYVPEEIKDGDVWPPTEEVIVKRSTWERLSRKFKEEPLVPLGTLATVIALGGASKHLQSGNRTQFNRWLRFRVIAQGATVIAALGGSIYYQQARRTAKAIETAERARIAQRESEAAEQLAKSPQPSTPTPILEAKKPDADIEAAPKTPVKKAKPFIDKEKLRATLGKDSERGKS